MRRLRGAQQGNRVMWWRFLGAVAVTLAAASLPGAARAVNCGDTASQSEMNICADNEYRAADAELNRVYRRYSKVLEAHERALLVEAERAWVRFRDKDCTAETAESEGGSMHPLVYSGCLTRMTRTRTKELESRLRCRQHAESC